MRTLTTATLCAAALALAAPGTRAQDAQTSPRQKQPTAEIVRERANENVVYLMGGQLGATYIQMAHDIAVVANTSKNTRVIPAVGGAAVQNIRDVLLLRGVDLGIATVQSIKAFEKSGEPGSEGLLSKVAYISILSNDELHVLARPEIKTLQDLAGKKVSFNNQGSSTALLAPLVFKALGVEVVPVFMAQGDAIAAMHKGEVAATVCGCPKPVPAFASLKPDSGFSLIDVDYGDKLEKDYHPATLTTEDYPHFLQPGTRVNTVATNSILITYNWPKNHHRYEKVARFVDAFFTNFPEMQKPPRLALWKNVNLAGKVNGIQRFSAAQEWLERGKLVVSAPAPTKALAVTTGAAAGAAPKAKQPEPAKAPQPAQSATENPQLFREFMDWLNKQQSK
jgi:TRAP transporter TAXI family solute receptor